MSVGRVAEPVGARELRFPGHDVTAANQRRDVAEPPGVAVSIVAYDELGSGFRRIGIVELTTDGLSVETSRAVGPSHQKAAIRQSRCGGAELIAGRLGVDEEFAADPRTRGVVALAAN
jgi:hypothetical protein